MQDLCSVSCGREAPLVYSSAIFKLPRQLRTVARKVQDHSKRHCNKNQRKGSIEPIFDVESCFAFRVPSTKHVSNTENDTKRVGLSYPVYGRPTTPFSCWWGFRTIRMHNDIAKLQVIPLRAQISIISLDVPRTLELLVYYYNGISTRVSGVVVYAL